LAVLSPVATAAGRLIDRGAVLMARSPALSDPEHLRAGELDVLSAILSWEGRDKLASILTDTDVATLKHLAEAGMARIRSEP
jgi:hypothetical protein